MSRVATGKCNRHDGQVFTTRLKKKYILTTHRQSRGSGFAPRNNHHNTPWYVFNATMATRRRAESPGYVGRRSTLSIPEASLVTRRCVVNYRTSAFYLTSACPPSLCFRVPSHPPLELDENVSRIPTMKCQLNRRLVDPPRELEVEHGDLVRRYSRHDVRRLDAQR